MVFKPGRRRLFLPYLAVILTFGITAALSGYFYIKKEGRINAQSELSNRLELICRQISNETISIQKQLKVADPDEKTSTLQFNTGLDYIYKNTLAEAETSTNRHIRIASQGTAGSGGFRQVDIIELIHFDRTLKDRCNGRLPAIVLEYSTRVSVRNSENMIVITGGKFLTGNDQWIDAVKSALPKQGETSLFAGRIRVTTTLRDTNGIRLAGSLMPDGVAEYIYGNGKTFADRVRINGRNYLSAYREVEKGSGIAIAIAVPEEPYILNEWTFIAILTTLLIISALSTALIAVKLTKLIDKSEQELKNSNKKLEELNGSYINMVGIVSHDLKNILSSVGLNVNAVHGGYYGPVTEKQKSALAAASSTLEYFEATVKNFLDYTRFEGKTPPINPERTLLTEDIILPVLATFKPQIDKNGISVSMDISEQSNTVFV
ncbi:MAG: cache domain-containing protein, partial [Fibrobacteres bacterium]|nr:cache domain-containing protein [Fibrobacterota bacterium]